MTDARYNVVVTREGQPAHQMAEMSATVSGTILLDIMRAMIEGGRSGRDLGLGWRDRIRDLQVPYDHAG